MFPLDSLEPNKRLIDQYLLRNSSADKNSDKLLFDISKLLLNKSDSWFDF
jgi:hypothetical protein